VALLLLGVVVWFVAPGGPAPQADAQAGPTQFVVTSVFDGADVDPGDGLCESAAGTCTLRAALQEANLEPGTNVVLLQAGTYSLGIEETPFTDAETGDLDVQDDLVLQGVGAGDTIVEGDGNDRVFDLTAVAAATISVEIEGLTIRGGETASNGGALRVGAGVTLTLSDVALRGNSRRHGRGDFHAGDGPDNRELRNRLKHRGEARRRYHSGCRRHRHLRKCTDQQFRRHGGRLDPSAERRHELEPGGEPAA